MREAVVDAVDPVGGAHEVAVDGAYVRDLAHAVPRLAAAACHPPVRTGREKGPVVEPHGDRGAEPRAGVATVIADQHVRVGRDRQPVRPGRQVPGGTAVGQRELAHDVVGDGDDRDAEVGGDVQLRRPGLFPVDPFLVDADVGHTRGQQRRGRKPTGSPADRGQADERAGDAALNADTWPTTVFRLLGSGGV